MFRLHIKIDTLFKKIKQNKINQLTFYILCAVFFFVFAYGFGAALNKFYLPEDFQSNALLEYAYEENISHEIVRNKDSFSENLVQLFNEKNLSSNLIPHIEEDKNTQRKALENAFIKSDLDAFTFHSEDDSDPMESLIELIHSLYSEKVQPRNTPLLNIAQEINASIFQTFDLMSIGTQDILFSESAVRLNRNFEPYPFLVLELHNKQAKSSYFVDENKRLEFIRTLKKNLSVRTLPSSFTRNNKEFSLKNVKIIDEKHFIYVTYENIISHIIRFEARKDRISPYNFLKKDTAYISLIIDDIGENFNLARAFMDLPFPIILAIWPQSTYATNIATIAHEKGLPVFLHQPMQPLSRAAHEKMPKSMQEAYTPDMGKGGLTIDMDEAKIKSILQENILNVPHLRGINNHMGSLFTSNAKSVDAFLESIKKIMPQLFIFDSYTHKDSVLFSMAKKKGFLAGQRHFFIDNAGMNIKKELEKVTAYAKTHGHVYAIGHARAKTLAILTAWEIQEKNIVFTLPSY